jgi:translation initiation factor IF-2
MDNIKEEKKKESADEVVFPCVLKIIPNCIFNKKDPIILGVNIVEGTLKVSIFFFQSGYNVCDDRSFLCIRLYCFALT